MDARKEFFVGCDPEHCLQPKSEREWVVVRAKFLLPLTEENPNERIEDGYILSHGNEIVEVGKYSKEIGKNIITNHESLLIVGKGDKKNEVFDDDPIPRIPGILLPGFVKAHGHNHESPLIGLNKEAQLVEWLDKCVNPFTGMMNTNRDKLIKLMEGLSPNLITYRKAVLDDIMFGITSAQCHHCNYNKYHVAELVQAVLETGTKCIIAVGSQDRYYDPKILDLPASVAIERLNKYYDLFMENNKKDGLYKRIEIIPGPDQDFSNSEELLRIQGKWAKEHNTLIHIHSSEEKNTTEWFRKEFGKTPIEHLRDSGILSPSCIVAHQVHTTPEDIKILYETGTGVAHNPLANTVLSSGMPPIKEMLDYNEQMEKNPSIISKSPIRIAISTDGSGSADMQNIICAMRTTAQYYRAKHMEPLFDASTLLSMITRIPAQMLRLNAGQLKSGYDSDWVVLDITKTNMIPTHIENAMENIVWASAGNECRYVCANGVVVIDDYEYSRIPYDIEKSLDLFTNLTKEFVEYRKTQAELVATGVRGSKK